MSKIILNLPDVPGRVCVHLNYDVFNDKSLSFVPATSYFNSFEVLSNERVSLTVVNKTPESNV